MPNSKKGTAGSGSIRKKTITKPNGKKYTYWEARITVGIDSRTGRQKQRSVSGKTEREVAQKLRQIAAEKDSGAYVEPVKLTVGEWLDIWAEKYLDDVKMLTREMYLSNIRTHLKPALGGRKLEALQTMEIQSLYKALQQQENSLSAKTIKNIHGVLHKALQQAVEVGLLRTNPANACKLPRIEKKLIRPLDDDGIKAFLTAIQGSRFENVYIVTLFTGMREGEVLGLSWDNVDFTGGTILVGQQLQNKRDGTGEYAILSPKNGKARKITPAPYVMEVLKRQQAQQKEWREAAGSLWRESGLVFTNEAGEHLATRTVYKQFKKLVEKAGYPNTRFHDLRHSYAVAAIQSGDDIKTVQENLGHYTAAFTLDVYGHVTERMKQASANRMQGYISSLNAS